MNKDYYAILMAGGVGARFWPVSTATFPKQFHDMLGTGETLLQKTFFRLSKIISIENILILTNEIYKDLVLEQLPSVHQNRVLCEPAMRNTAPCILYASLKIQKENPNASVLVAPSDHWIEDENHFIRDVQKAFDFCEEENVLMTLGIKPTFPNTGYGYIEFDSQYKNNTKKVVQFREKPNYQTAKSFVKSGTFLWNAGIFIWKVAVIIDAFQKFQPTMYNLFYTKNGDIYNTKDEDFFVKTNYGEAENISIDYAILEKATNVYVLPVSFDWNDLGTWGALYDKLPKDSDHNAVVNAKILATDATNNIIRTDKEKLVVLEGLHDYIIVDKDNVLLIYPKEKEQEIRKFKDLI